MGRRTEAESRMTIGLRIDVDTLKGTREGVPRLLRILDRHGIRAAFFFSVGPDNMGRHIWRLLKPKFLLKMLRTDAAGLYGWDILFKGTFGPGPLIAKHTAAPIRSAAECGHEIGVHAWDHYLWQVSADRMTESEARKHLTMAYETLSGLIGRAPDCSAAPGWKCTDAILLAKEAFAFRYNSDCRGNGGAFMPVVDGQRLGTPQLPVGIPTYDELAGRTGITRSNYNRRLLDLIADGDARLLNIHAEVEGGVCAAEFDDFLSMAESEGFRFVAPGELLPANLSDLPGGRIASGEVPGREGTLAVVARGQAGC